MLAIGGVTLMRSRIRIRIRIRENCRMLIHIKVKRNRVTARYRSVLCTRKSRKLGTNHGGGIKQHKNTSNNKQMVCIYIMTYVLVQAQILRVL
jgi:hypothetical protein